MAKFCGKCGSKLDETTGFCPNCDAARVQQNYDGLVRAKTRVREERRNIDKPAKKKSAQKEKRVNWSTGKKVRRFLLKLVLMVFVLGIISVLIWTAFGSVNKNSLSSTGAMASVEEQLDAILASENNLNVVSDDGQRIDSLAGGETSSKILNSISYLVISTEVDGNTASAVIRFNIPDTVTMTEQFVQSQQENAEFNAWLKEQLDVDYPTIEKEIILKMVYQDNHWSLVATDDLYNILTGGALEYYIAQRQSAYDILKEAIENEENN